MKTYIAILRGINVGGNKLIKMPDLKKLFELMKFKDVVTYIQSGNVIFKADKKEQDILLAKRIASEILKKYKFEVPVVIRNVEELEKITSGNPFLKEKNIDPEKLHVTFLEEAPGKTELEIAKTINYPPERFVIQGKDIFVYCPNGYGNAKLTNNFFESKLKILTTTRNWKTVNKLLELAK
jgi:uncharacterized protein (DUF1697 family)